MAAFDRSKYETCPHCGNKFRIGDDIELHRFECEGGATPGERFGTGDRVRFSLFGQHRLSSRDHDRRFEVISLQTDYRHTVRVRDVDSGTCHTFAHSFLARIGSSRQV